MALIRYAWPFAITSSSKRPAIYQLRAVSVQAEVSSQDANMQLDVPIGTLDSRRGWLTNLQGEVVTLTKRRGH